MSDKKKMPALPQDVASAYDCSIIPTVVTISKPVEVKGTWDLRTITLENAGKLAKAGKYLTLKKGKEEKR